MYTNFLEKIQSNIAVRGSYTLGAVLVPLMGEKCKVGPYTITKCQKKMTGHGYMWHVEGKTSYGYLAEATYTADRIVGVRLNDGRPCVDNDLFAHTLNLRARWESKKNAAKDENINELSAKEARTAGLVAFGEMMRLEMMNREKDWHKLKPSITEKAYELVGARLLDSDLRTLRMMLSFAARYSDMIRYKISAVSERKHKSICRRLALKAVKFYYGETLTHKEQQFALRHFAV